MGWTETPSLSFTARHETSQADEALTVLESLEAHRARLETLFPELPSNVTVVLHDSPLQLALAHPYLPIGRRLSSPAGRRYMAGWFSSDSELHLLAPHLLRRQAAGPESLKALMLTPERTYTLLVVGFNNPALPPPLRPGSLARLIRFAWLAEGPAQFISGQIPHLRAAIARRLRGRTPQLPPGPRDAALLGGSVFDLLAAERGMDACVRLAIEPPGQARRKGGERLIEDAFGSPLADIRLRWRTHLERLARAEPSVSIDAPEAAPELPL